MTASSLICGMGLIVGSFSLVGLTFLSVKRCTLHTGFNNIVNFADILSIMY